MTKRKNERPFLEFRKKSYGFSGELLPLPDPSTYDASAYKPPGRRFWIVEIWSTGDWAILENDVLVDSGDGATMSIAEARQIVEDWRKKKARMF